MRMVLYALAFSMLATMAPTQDASSQEIELTIQSQIEAFLNDDFDKAFTFASPNIQKLFQTPERFGNMVRQGYPMVWRPAAVEFLDLDTINGQTWQKVMVTDVSGQVHVLGYQMIEATDGWQINGVQILRSPQIGV